MRNMSFALTKRQYRERSKTVTRRTGWSKIKPGDFFAGVEKGQGLKKGESVVVMGYNKCECARWEPLRRMIDDPEYGRREVIREGFPEMTPDQFVKFFCETHKGCTPETLVNRIEFSYL
jgi:hypothetical protein